MTYEEIKQVEEIKIYIRQADEALQALGYTEHSFAHVTCVAERSGYILETLGFPARTVELAKIAGYLHDLGNLINRVDHSQSGAIMAFRILDHMHFPPEEIGQIVSAIGNHDEGFGVPVSALAAALILADKSDVRRNRVRNQDISTFDIHDRVNYAVTHADLILDVQERKIRLELKIDNEICPVLEYFEIFMDRTMMSKYAAKYLRIWFELVINDTKLL